MKLLPYYFLLLLKEVSEVLNQKNRAIVFQKDQSIRNYNLFHLVSPLLALFFVNGCGLKGKPLPPLAPRELGIGKPVYKGVDKELKEKKKPSEPQ